MKNLIYVLLAVISISACKQEQRYFSSSPEIDVVKAGIAAYEAGEWDTWKSHFTDNGEVYVNSPDSITVDERLKGLQEMASALSTYGFVDKGQFYEMIIDDDKETWVNFWGQWSGTFKYNEKKISVPVHLTLQFIDGKISEEHVYFDGTSLNAEFTDMEAAAKAAMEEVSTE